MNAIPPPEQLREGTARKPRQAGETVRLTPEGIDEAALPDAVAMGAAGEPAGAGGAGGAGDARGARGAESAAEAAARPAGRTAETGVPPHLAAVEVTLSVEIGRRELALAELLAVEPGQIFELDRLTDEPVRVLVNGTPFARGEVVAIGERFGIRLTAIEGEAGAP